MKNGDSPAIVDFSNGAGFRVVATTESQPKAAAVLVHSDSTAKSFADLKGKKIIFLRGTNLHILFLNLLEKYQLKPSDFQVINLSGPDARSAFMAKASDAILTVDPALASLETVAKAKILIDGSDNLVANYYVYTVTGKALREKEAALRLVLPKLKEAIAWAAANRKQQAEFLSTSKILPFPKAAILRGYNRCTTKLVPITPELVSYEQKIADLFYKAGVITKNRRCIIKG